MGLSRNEIEESNNLMLLNDENILSRSNVLITSKYHASLLESKIMALAMFRVQQEGIGLSTYFTTKELVDTLGLHEGNAIYQKLRNASIDMVSHKYLLEDPESERFIVFPIVTECVYDRGVFKITFHENVRSHIFRLKSSFTQMSLPILMSFGTGGKRDLRSNFTFRIYEILSTMKYHLTDRRPEYSFRYDLADFKMTIGAVDVNQPSIQKAIGLKNLTPAEILEKYVKEEGRKFDRWSDFRDRVLIPAQGEIGNKTDLEFSFVPVRAGRGGKVCAIIFTIRRNGKFVDEDRDKALEYDNIRRVEGMLDFSASTSDIKALLSEAGNDLLRVRNACSLLRKQKDPDAIANKIGWLRSAIRDGWEGAPVPVIRGLGYAETKEAMDSEILRNIAVSRLAGAGTKKKTKVQKKVAGAFNDFEQRDYDYGELEKKLILGKT